MAFAFEKLLVYRKAVAFADAICTLTKGFPRRCFFLADQLNRVALTDRQHWVLDQVALGSFRAAVEPATAAANAVSRRASCGSR